MRVNIYAQEITDRVEIVTATADNTGTSFVCVRFWLDSADCLKPPQHPDDDSSAVTFWVKSGKEGFKSGDHHQLMGMFAEAVSLLDNTARDEARDSHPECAYAYRHPYVRRQIVANNLLFLTH